jgi:hypothetical protein
MGGARRQPQKVRQIALGRVVMNEDGRSR